MCAPMLSKLSIQAKKLYNENELQEVYGDSIDGLFIRHVLIIYPAHYVNALNCWPI